MMAICVPCFLVVLILAWRSPEMDDSGRIVTRNSVPSPSIVPFAVPDQAEASRLSTGGRPDVAITR
jgi:hypothetical protein